MRYLVLLICLALLCSCQSARGLPTEQRQVVNVHQVDGATKDQLYQRAHVWLAHTFVDSKQVLRVQDQAAGTLVGHVILPHALDRMGASFDLGVTLTIECKEGRYRTTFDNYQFISETVQRDVYVDSGEFDKAKAACAKLDAELLAAVAEKPKDF